jgi:hypothetical protein
VICFLACVDFVDFVCCDLSVDQVLARFLGFWECMCGLLIGLVSHIVIDVHDLKLLARKVKDWKRADP